MFFPAVKFVFRMQKIDWHFRLFWLRGIKALMFVNMIELRLDLNWPKLLALFEISTFVTTREVYLRQMPNSKLKNVDILVEILTSISSKWQYKFQYVTQQNITMIFNWGLWTCLKINVSSLMTFCIDQVITAPLLLYFALLIIHAIKEIYAHYKI